MSRCKILCYVHLYMSAYMPMIIEIWNLFLTFIYINILDGIT